MGKITQIWSVGSSEEKENLDTDKIDQGMDNTDDKGTNEKNYVKAIQEQVIICDF